ncbi:MAG: hypothetical protein ACRDHX_11560 [Chloroflexota bacterium]
MQLDDIRKKLGHTPTKATVLAGQLPTPDDQPSGSDFLNISLQRATRGSTRSARSILTA